MSLLRWPIKLGSLCWHLSIILASKFYEEINERRSSRWWHWMTKGFLQSFGMLSGWSNQACTDAHPGDLIVLDHLVLNTFLCLMVIAILHCTDPFIFHGVGSSDVPSFMLLLVQSILTVIWTPSKYFINFYYGLGILVVIWTSWLWINWTLPMGSRNPTIMSSQNLLVPLTMLSLNHQNHSNDLSGVIFLTIWYNNLANRYVYGSNIAGTMYVTTIGGELSKGRVQGWYSHEETM